MSQLQKETEYWGSVDQQEIYLHHLLNTNGIQISITNFGATITNISVPDREGNFADIVLGYDDLKGYLNDPYYMGGIVGRFANRIAGGWIALDGKAHRLTVKPGGYHHHGGAIGFNKKVWKAEKILNNGFPAVKLEYLSADGEEGFPGNLLTTVTYTLNNKNQLLVNFSATTDKTTILNLTQHSYFNLAGQDKGSILQQKLTMPLAHYLPVNANQVPTGEIATVINTPFDFTEGKAIGERIDTDNEQLNLSAGYDHSWVIKANDTDELRLAAIATEEDSGRILKVYTTEPAVHVYTGNFLGDTPGKGGYVYPKRSGFCLETQHYPDAPNHANFPATVLKPGAVFKSTTIFEFDVDN